MKQKNQVAVLIGLLPILGLVLYLNHSNSSAPAGAIALVENYPPMGIEDPTPHKSILEDTRKTEYTKTIRNIFTVYVPLPPPPPSQGSTYQKTTVDPPAPPPPLVLPPNIKFFGYGTVPVDGARRAFLTDGEDVFIIGEGETLLGRYRILKVGNANLEFEEIGSGRRGTAVLEEQAPSA